MSGTKKVSYTVSCPSLFREAVTALAEKRGVNVADLARSVLLVVPAAMILKQEDPGEPEKGDREDVILKSGPSKGRPWRRKPRLQVRLPPGYDPIFIRKTLALALDLDKNTLTLSLKNPDEPLEVPKEIQKRLIEKDKELNLHKDELKRMETLLAVLAFDPLPDGIRNRADALHILGFPPDSHPDSRSVRTRYRMLATVHHPDSPQGSHQRMSQLNSAMDLLRRGG